MFEKSKSGNATFTVQNECVWRLHHILSVISFTVALNTPFASSIEQKILVDFVWSRPHHVNPVSHSILHGTCFGILVKSDLEQQRAGGG